MVPRSWSISCWLTQQGLREAPGTPVWSARASATHVSPVLSQLLPSPYVTAQCRAQSFLLWPHSSWAAAMAPFPSLPSSPPPPSLYLLTSPPLPSLPPNPSSFCSSCVYFWVCFVSLIFSACCKWTYPLGASQFCSVLKDFSSTQAHFGFHLTHGHPW